MYNKYIIRSMINEFRRTMEKNKAIWLYSLTIIIFSVSAITLTGCMGGLGEWIGNMAGGNEPHQGSPHEEPPPEDPHQQQNNQEPQPYQPTLEELKERAYYFAVDVFLNDPSNPANCGAPLFDPLAVHEQGNNKFMVCISFNCPSGSLATYTAVEYSETKDAFFLPGP
jgi:hypothetical protein